MITVDPRICTDVVQWSDFMYPSLEQAGVPSRLDDPDHWQSWAAELLSFSGFGTTAVPDPYQFGDWRDWAARFNEAVGSD